MKRVKNIPGTLHLATYKKKYNPHDAPAPHTFGVTPWYNPLNPSFLPIVTSALAIPLYWGRAVEIAKPSLTEKWRSGINNTVTDREV